MELEFFTVYEIAKLLKVSQRTVYNWIDFGYLKAVKVGSGKGTIRVLKTDLEAFLQENTNIDKPYKPRRLKL